MPPIWKEYQAHVEQKNGEVVRRMVGYRRYESIAAAKQLARLYAPVRLFVNTFQPSFKLAKKMHDGARNNKRAHFLRRSSSRACARRGRKERFARLQRRSQKQSAADAARTPYLP